MATSEAHSVLCRSFPGKIPGLTGNDEPLSNNAYPAFSVTSLPHHLPQKRWTKMAIIDRSDKKSWSWERQRRGPTATSACAKDAAKINHRMVLASSILVFWAPRCECPWAHTLQGHQADAQISQSSEEIKPADLKQMFTYNTITCFCFPSASRQFEGLHRPT